MKPLIGTTVYKEYWAKRLELLKEEKELIEKEITLIEEARTQDEAPCTTCSKGICTNGCM